MPGRARRNQRGGPILSEILRCADERWSPTIGDPTVYGWATVAVFAAAALACTLLAASPKGRPERPFWIALALLMAALAINKQLDLQSAVTAVGRCVAQLQGWYGSRRAVQALFALIVGAVSLAGLVALAAAMRRHLARTWPAVLGTGFVAGFVLVRAVSFTHVDAFLKMPLGTLRVNHLLENGGPILVILNALALLFGREQTTGRHVRGSGARPEAESSDPR